MKYLYVEYGSVDYTVRDLLFGISYRSGADSVVCLLDYLGLSMQDFAVLMNQKADEIGLKNTNFGGAIGMDRENNRTTCRDMAAIMAYAMENPLCKEFFGGVLYRLDHITIMTYKNSTLGKTLDNMGIEPSDVLGEKYSIIATKSGLEDLAGYCLVSCIKNNDTGDLFVLVTANAKKSNQNPILDMQEIFLTFNP
jgi:D-alanyl-D-alanine carboxypeptidase